MKALILLLVAIFLFNWRAQAAVCANYDKDTKVKVEKLLSSKRYFYSFCTQCQDKQFKSYQAEDFVFNREGNLVFATGPEQGRAIDLAEIYVEVEHNQAEKVAAKINCPNYQEQYSKRKIADDDRRVAIDLFY